MMHQKLEYTHNNPVARGYVDDPTHWRYSSARNYAGLLGLIEIKTENDLHQLRQFFRMGERLRPRVWSRVRTTT